MIESSWLGALWSDDELLLLLDMYFNGGRRDSHDHDDIARFLGRFKQRARSFADGAVNLKLAEIAGLVDGSRAPRHPGDRIAELIQQFRDNRDALRIAARDACVRLVADARGPVPDYVSALLAIRQ